jgi:hypothetical protein
MSDEIPFPSAAEAAEILRDKHRGHTRSLALARKGITEGFEDMCQSCGGRELEAHYSEQDGLWECGRCYLDDPFWRDDYRGRRMSSVYHGDAKEELKAELADDTPRKFLAHCPAHDDSSASLCVTITTKRTLMHCFAGCAWKDLLIALEMRPKDLPPHSPYGRAKRAEKSWDPLA